MEKLIRTLQFFRVVDESGNLSLTNIALVVVLVSLVNRPELSVADIGSLVAAIAGYQFKRWMQPDAPAEDQSELSDALKSLQTKVAALEMGQQINRKR